MKRKSPLSTVVLTVVLIFLYLPIAMVVLYSFNANSARIPVEFTGFSGKWFRELFLGKNHYGEGLVYSARVAAISVAVSMLIGTLGAAGMAWNHSGGRKSLIASAFEALVILPIMIPEIVLGLAFMVVLNFMGIRQELFRLVLAHTTFCIPYVFLNVKSRLKGMDPALFDAARDLGASPFRVFCDVTLPLCVPAVLSGGFLALAMSLDDFVISFFVYTNSEGTLPIMIYSSVKVGVSPTVNALCTLIMGAVFLCALLWQLFRRRRKKTA